MQKKTRSTPITRSTPPAPMLVEIKKTSRASAVCVTEVIGVTELSDSEVALASHGGRINIRGEGLRLTVYSNRTVEIGGRVMEVSLGYSRS